jgi:L-ascorbate metabolism protein UlaG (beta-lactamase superfamily)
MTNVADGTRGDFTWLGHSAVEVRTPGGKRLLFDPWLENPRSPRGPETVDQLDLLLVSHGHSDHLDNSVDIARRTHPTWPCIHELSLLLDHESDTGDAEVIGMNKGGTVETRGLKVTMVGADHSCGDWVEGGISPRYLGEPVGFVVELENGFRIYHAGDTAVTAEMSLTAQLFQPDLAFLPIGGHYTMDPRGAALAAELLGVRTVVPIHFGTFPILSGTPDELRRALAERSLDIAVVSPEPGETVSFPG